MSADNFPASLAHVLASEGGYVNDAKDPGGATNCGITQREYDDWRTRHGEPARDVRQLDPNEREAIYRSDYWNAVSGDALPAGVDYCVFDLAVNSGVSRAARYLQRAVGVADDGRIGPATLAAVKAVPPRRIVEAICAARLAFLRTRDTWEHFGTGWSRRVAEVQRTAEGMA